MRIRRIVLLGALIAFCAVPSAVASTGNGVIAFTLAYFSVQTTDRYLDGDPADNSVWGPLSWSPDGAKLMYWARRGGARVVNADGTNAHPVIPGWPYDGYAWSPVCWIDTDLVELAKTTFLGPTTGGPNVADYYAAHPDGSGLRPLTTGGLDVGSVGVCVQAMRTFVFTRADGELFSVSADGGQPVRLPLTGGTIVPSPDGRQLAWSTEAGLFLVKAGGSLLVRNLADPVVGSPLVWSPDSKELAFWGHVVSVVTGATRSLGSAIPITWSPDGTKILFGRDRATYVMNADGTCPSYFIGSGPLGAHNFAWQPVPGGAQSAPFRCTDVRITGLAGVDSIPLEGAARFAFTVTSHGNEAAAGVRFEPPEIYGGVPMAISSNRGLCDLGSTSCELGALDPGASATVILEVRSTHNRSDPASSVAVIARVSVQGVDADLYPRSTSVSVPSEECTIVGTDGRDVLTGYSRGDSMCGLRGPDRLSGLRGRDLIRGGFGRDLLYGGAGRDRLFGDEDGDRIVSRDRFRDEVDCGDGYDTVIADRLDRVAADCERVHRGRP
jgi:hypothetical protein